MHKEQKGATEETLQAPLSRGEFKGRVSSHVRKKEVSGVETVTAQAEKQAQEAHWPCVCAWNTDCMCQWNGVSVLSLLTMCGHGMESLL